MKISGTISTVTLNPYDLLIPYDAKNLIHLRVLNKSYSMNTNMTGFGWFSKIVHPCA